VEQACFKNNFKYTFNRYKLMGDMEVEELRGPFDTIIRKFHQKAQDLESKGMDDEAQQYYLNANKIKEIKDNVIRE
jgi:hypothetical protein